MPMDGQRRKRTRKKSNFIVYNNTNTRWRSWLIRMNRLVKDLFFPRRCFVCDKILSPWEYKTGVHRDCEKSCLLTGDRVCAHCGARLLSDEQYCGECSKETRLFSAFEQGKSIFVYRGCMKRTMYRFKYYNRQEYAIAFANIAAKQYEEWIKRAGIEVIVPVPLHSRKKRMRGYNQAEVFARELAREMLIQNGIKLKVVTRGIHRKSDTKPLKTLQKNDRYFHLKNAFQISPFVLKYGKIALVVDDIYTTGATVNSLSASLQKAGFYKIYFLSVCIGKGL